MNEIVELVFQILELSCTSTTVLDTGDDNTCLWDPSCQAACETMIKVARRTDVSREANTQGMAICWESSMKDMHVMIHLNGKAPFQQTARCAQCLIGAILDLRKEDTHVSFAGFRLLCTGSFNWHSLCNRAHLSQIWFPGSLTHLAFAFAQVMQLRVEVEFEAEVAVRFAPETPAVGR